MLLDDSTGSKKMVPNISEACYPDWHEESSRIEQLVKKSRQTVDPFAKEAGRYRRHLKIENICFSSGKVFAKNNRVAAQ